MNNDQTMTDLCRKIAEEAHKNHTRRPNKPGAKRLPYITHPRAVATGLQAKGYPWYIVCAGWLHDVPEETFSLPEMLLEKGVPPLVVKIVDALTKRLGEKYEDYIERLRHNPDAILVKWEDIEHNLSCKPTPAAVKKYEYARIMLMKGPIL